MADAVLEITGRSASKTAAVHGRRHRGVGRWAVLGVVVLGLLATLFPFVLTIINAIKTSAEYAAGGPLALPHGIDLVQLQKYWDLSDFGRKLLNSAIISGCVAVFGVILSTLNAYAIGIGRVRGSRVILVLLLLGIMVPQESIVYPLYYMAKAVGVYDTQLAVIIVLSVLQSAFGTYLLSSVLSSFRP